MKKHVNLLLLLIIGSIPMKDQPNLKDPQKTKIKNQSLQKARNLSQAVLRAKAAEVKFYPAFKILITPTSQYFK